MADIFLWLLLLILILLWTYLAHLYLEEYVEKKYPTETGDEYFDNIERFRDDFS
jgi:hypothetical protein